jgi:hypothetical protein
VATRNGCQGGKSFEGYAPSGKEPTPRTAFGRRGNEAPETWRTPWPVAGCNRPAGCCAEKTVGVGWNDKGGTSLEVGASRPKGGLRPTSEWTRGICTGGGAIFEPHERSPDRTGRAARPRRRGQGPREPKSVFEGEVRPRVRHVVVPTTQLTGIRPSLRRKGGACGKGQTTRRATS